MHAEITVLLRAQQASIMLNYNIYRVISKDFTTAFQTERANMVM